MAAAAAGDIKTADAVKVYNSTTPDAPARLIAFDCMGSAAALAFGKRLAVVVSGSEKPIELGASAVHADVIRVLAFDPTGAWLLTADDSKTTYLWRTSNWTLCHTFKTPKKPTAAAFSLDGGHALVADKFGDVTVSATSGGSAALLLGHYCSTVAALAVSPDGKVVVSADRDNKVRVSCLPEQLLKGAHEIQSYCLGHESFVTSASFVSCGEGLVALVTAGGDGSVRLWNHLTGEQLAAMQLTERLPSGAEGDAAIQAAVAAAAANGQGVGAFNAAAKPPAGTAGGQDSTAKEPHHASLAPSGGTEEIMSSALDAASAGGLVASANGFDASVDDVIDSVVAIEGTRASGPAADEPAAAATAGGPAAVAAAAGCDDLGSAAAQATAAAAEANSFAVTADSALSAEADTSDTRPGAPKAANASDAGPSGAPSATQSTAEQQAAAEAAVLAAQASGDAAGGGSGGADEDDDGGHHSAPMHRSILSVSASGRQLAVAVEGQNEVVLLTVHLQGINADDGNGYRKLTGSLEEAGTVTLPEVVLPSQVAHDHRGRLWAVGGQVEGDAATLFSITSTSLKDDDVVGAQEADGTESASLSAALSAAAASCQLSADDAAVATAARIAVGGQVSEHLKNRQQRVDRQQRTEQLNGTRLDKRLKAAMAASATPASISEAEI